jgi:hypothetical protein
MSLKNIVLSLSPATVGTTHDQEIVRIALVLCGLSGLTAGVASV